MNKRNDALYELFDFREVDPGDPEEREYVVYIEHECLPPTDACTREEIQDRMDAAPELFLVAVDRGTGRIAGLVNGVATNDSVFRDAFFSKATQLHDPDGSIVMITGMDVMPEYRNRGLARELMRLLGEREKARGRKRMILTCVEDKIEMYRKFGFDYMGVSESVYGGTVWHDMDIEL